jgi:hypothetical protein
MKVQDNEYYFFFGFSTQNVAKHDSFRRSMFEYPVMKINAPIRTCVINLLINLSILFAKLHVLIYYFSV